jgi:hypothetical protein
MDEIRDKLDKIAEDVTEIKITMARNTASLELHMERTNIAEENLKILKTEVDSIKDVTDELKTDKAVVLKTIGILGAIGATILACIEAYKLLF